MRFVQFMFHFIKFNIETQDIEKLLLVIKHDLKGLIEHINVKIEPVKRTIVLLIYKKITLPVFWSPWDVQRTNR